MKIETVTKAWINAILLIITLVINSLGAAGLISGLTQKEISDMYLTIITPSPASFSIWSLIYTTLILSSIVMIIQVKKQNAYYLKVVDAISVLFWISSLLNVAWIVSFSFLLVELSTIFIFGFVVVLSMILQKLLKLQEGKRWLLPLAFGLYTGWLFIATVVNIAAALVKLNWDGFGIAASVWAAIILVIAVALIVVVQLRNRNAIFPLPIAWAYFGIYQFLRSPEGFNGQYGLVQVVALIGMAVLIGAAAIHFYRNQFGVLPKPSKAD
ncbi:MAG: tryptophan-rich sensory protein [Anaerolineae bacterium]|jgi:hypothetical protein|nr:tryptophan-rich sensory protein [Anaerolineae bacterium]